MFHNKASVIDNQVDCSMWVGQCAASLLFVAKITEARLRGPVGVIHIQVDSRSR